MGEFPGRNVREFFCCIGKFLYNKKHFVQQCTARREENSQMALLARGTKNPLTIPYCGIRMKDANNVQIESFKTRSGNGL